MKVNIHIEGTASVQDLKDMLHGISQNLVLAREAAGDTIEDEYEEVEWNSTFTGKDIDDFQDLDDIISQEDLDVYRKTMEERIDNMWADGEEEL